MSNVVRYRGQATGRGPSPALWGNVMSRMLTAPGEDGVLFYDDFINFNQHITDQNVQTYSSYIDTGVTLKQKDVNDPSGGEIGVMEVAGNDADNDEGHLATGGDVGGWIVISDTAGDECGVYFECRLKKASVAANALAFFVGLSEAGLCAVETLIDDTGEVASKDLIGFQVLQDDGDGVDFMFRKAGQTKVTVLANTTNMVANTYLKLGFRYQPWAVTSKRIAHFVNGAESGTYGTGTQIAAATFPDAEELGMLLATKVGAAAESTLQMDWWAAAVVLP